MRANIIFFIGFFLLAASLIVIDYLDKKELSLVDNLLQALFISIIMSGMFWFTNRNKKGHQSK